MVKGGGGEGVWLSAVQREREEGNRRWAWEGVKEASDEFGKLHAKQLHSDALSRQVPARGWAFIGQAKMTGAIRLLFWV